MLYDLDAATISALAAAAAATSAVALAAIQLSLGLKQSKSALIAAEAARKTAEGAGRQRVSEFRQAWIDNVRDTLSEYQSLLILAGAPRQTPGVDSPSWQDNIRFHALDSKLRLLLNPSEPATIELMNAIDAVMGQPGIIPKVAKNRAVIAAGQTILKTEWKRLERDLNSVQT